MWPFKKKDIPTLEFTDASTSAYSSDDITVIHVGRVIHGTITPTKYNTFKIELNGLQSERFTRHEAMESCIQKWESMHK